MMKGKRALTPSSQSTEYRCPICDTLVHITARFDPDPEYGDSIKVAVYCPKCQDQRVDIIDVVDYDLGKLVKKIGT